MSLIARPRVSALVASSLLLGAMLLTTACPRKAEGVVDRSGIKVRKVNMDHERLTDQQKANFEENRTISNQRLLNAMRLAFVNEDEQRCERDDDCTLANMHCCSCAYRGKLVGINKGSIFALAQRRTAVCSDYTCATQVSDDPTCNATRARCDAGKCVPDVPAGQKAPQGINVEPIPDDAEDAP